MENVIPIEPHWSHERLHDLIATRLQGWKFIVVSNREPFLHRRREGLIECLVTAGGLTSALRPVLVASGGTWIAHGSGDADRETADVDGCLMVPPPPETQSYKLRRVWLTPEQENGYYFGLANEGLWPLCHSVYTRPVFREDDWRHYKDVNRVFAEAVLNEAGEDPTFVFIQDYHFALLPRLLKESGKPNLVVASFWHIPWPSLETFRIFPWAEELLHGLSGNDLIGFHIRQHCQSFLETVDRLLEARVDREKWSITRQGNETAVRSFPISIDFAGQASRAEAIGRVQAQKRWQAKLQLSPDLIIGAGIERLDFTKGIPERLRALDIFFEQHPEWREKLTFIQIAAPSRSTLPAYQELESEVLALAKNINERWGTETWHPLHLLLEHHNTEDMTALHLACDFFVVSSLHDGMNLVAKEYCASRTENDGVLILSRFAGASRELSDALQINPFAPHEIAEAIYQAIIMEPSEQSRRMRRLRASIEHANVYRWAASIVGHLLHIDLPDTATTSADESLV